MWQVDSIVDSIRSGWAGVCSHALSAPLLSCPHVLRNLAQSLAAALATQPGVAAAFGGDGSDLASEIERRITNGAYGQLRSCTYEDNGETRTRSLCLPPLLRAARSMDGETPADWEIGLLARSASARHLSSSSAQALAHAHVSRRAPMSIAHARARAMLMCCAAAPTRR